MVSIIFLGQDSAYPDWHPDAYDSAAHWHNVKGIEVPLVVATKSTTIPMIDSSVAKVSIAPGHISWLSSSLV